MKMMKGMTVALAGLMATGALAETGTTATTTAAQTAAPVTKKKIVQKKPISRQALTTRRQAKQDRLTTPQSSAISAATATTSMPALTAGTSAAEAPKSMKKKTVLDNFRLAITEEYYGASIADPFSGWQTNKDDGFSQSDDSQELDTHITVGYAISNNLTISYNPYFFSKSDSPGASDGETFAFHPEASYLKLGIGKIYQSGNFKWNGDLRFYPGLGQGGDRLPLYIRTGQNLMYSISPRLTLAAYNTLRYYYRTDSAYNADHNSSGNVIDSRVTLGPALEYQMFGPVGLSLSFNMDFAHTHTNNTIAETEHYKGSAYGAYFELGSSIDLTKSINLNPYIDSYTHTMNVEAMQFGANLNWTIL